MGESSGPAQAIVVLGYRNRRARANAVNRWRGVPLGLLGSALAAVGYWRRLEEIRSPRPSTGRHYAWLFAGWACVVAGLLIPPYVLA